MAAKTQHGSALLEVKAVQVAASVWAAAEMRFGTALLEGKAVEVATPVVEVARAWAKVRSLASARTEGFFAHAGVLAVVHSRTMCFFEMCRSAGRSSPRRSFKEPCVFRHV